MKLRTAAIGAAALVVGGVTAGLGSPAFAQGGNADLAISFVGTTIDGGASGKFGLVHVTSAGPDAATGLLFTYDISALDDTKVLFALDACDPPVGDLILCGVEPDGIEDGENITLFELLEVVPGATGSAGTITVSIAHDGTDPDSSDNSATAEVVIAESGVDLTVFAPDIANEAVFDEDALSLEFLDNELVPGSETAALVFVENQGTATANGIEISVTLPEHASFTFPEPECTHAVGDSTTTCEYAQIVLAPSDLSGFCDSEDSCILISFPVKVSDDAPSPATLTGGAAEAWDMGLQVITTMSTAAGPGVDPAMAEEMLPDIDPSDNVDTFSFFIGEVDDSGGGGGGGGDGDLPATGSPLFLITALGAVLLVTGVALYVATRRRRVNLSSIET